MIVGYRIRTSREDTEAFCDPCTSAIIRFETCQQAADAAIHDDDDGVEDMRCGECGRSLLDVARRTTSPSLLDRYANDAILRDFFAPLIALVQSGAVRVTHVDDEGLPHFALVHSEVSV